MPLIILLILVVGGIAAIALALHLLGLTGQKHFATDLEAMTAWRREFGPTPINTVLRSADQSAALIVPENGLGLVWGMGADTTARPLTGARVAQTKTGLTITLPDYTARKVRLKLSFDEATKWMHLIKERQQ